MGACYSVGSQEKIAGATCAPSYQHCPAVQGLMTVWACAMAVDKWCHNVKCRLFSKRVRVGAASKICPFRGGGCGKALFAVKPRGGAAKVVAPVASACWFASGMWRRVTAALHMYFALVRARRILARACGDAAFTTPHSQFLAHSARALRRLPPSVLHFHLLCLQRPGQRARQGSTSRRARWFTDACAHIRTLFVHAHVQYHYCKLFLRGKADGI